MIAGMHRSGTSYLAKSLSLLGLRLPKSIRPGSPDNPKGHYESFDVAQYHERLLTKMNLSWDTFILPPEEWFVSEHEIKAVVDLCNKVKRDYPGKEPIILKDPRLSLFLPAWKKIVDRLGMQGFYIIPFRHPFEVAASLNKRNKISRARALMIWLAHLFSEEKYSRDVKRSFLCFPKWTNNIELSIEKVEKDLDVCFPKKNKRNLLLVKKEFEESLVHYNEPQSQLASNEIEQLSIDVFNSFLNLEIDPNDDSAILALDKYRAKFKELATQLSELLNDMELNKFSHIEQQAVLSGRKKIAAQVELLQGQQTEDKDRITELEKKLQNSQSEAEQSTAQVRTLRRQVVESEERAEDFKKQLQEIVDTNRVFDKENKDLRVRNNMLAKEFEQMAEYKSRFAELDKKQQEIVDTNRVLDKENNDLRVRNNMLAKEFEQTILELNEQKLKVARPLYRNIYRMTGFMLRKYVSSTLVESLKKVAPNPDGVPKQLTYKTKLIKDVATPFEIFSTPVATTALPDIFILSIINWNFRYQRPQHIAQGLAATGRRVFYVEMEMTGGDIKLTTVTKNLYRVRLSGRNISHIQPYTGQPDSKQMDGWLAAFYQFCDAVSCTSFKQVIIQHPFWWNLARHLSPEHQIIFDCMDDISGFSNTEPFLLDLERDLLAKCDKLIVSSQYLLEKYEHYQTPILIRNAADIDNFMESMQEVPRPAFLELSFNEGDSEVIKVGYVGAIAEWFDADLLAKVAESEPFFEFHICGAVTAPEPSLLDKLDNIKMYGEIPYSDVPGFLNEMDVMIIPFKIVPIIQACDPVKFYEYSAMGKPTVTTALPELSRASNLTFVATTPLEFREQIFAAYKKGKTDQFRKQLCEYAAKNTWNHRISCFEGALTEMPKVSIVILGYGDPELTKGALYSLFESGPSYPNMEILVVDNGSSSETLNEVKGFIGAFPNVTMIENGENLGFAKGNNVGLEAATGEYVMLLNNDTVVAPGAVHAMVCHLARNPEIGAVGPLTNSIGNEAKLFVEYGDMAQMRFVARSATTGYRGMYTSIPVVAYFAVMFRRKDLKIFGLLSEEYGRGMFEDDDHCAVIKDKNYICALAEDAFVHHHHSASFSKIDADAHDELFENNKVLFESKWGKWKPHKYREGRPMPSYKSRG